MPSPPQQPDTGELFARLLTELQEGRRPDLEALCAESGGTRKDLREAWRDWQRGRSALGDHGTSPEIDALLARELGDADDDEKLAAQARDPAPSDSAWTGVLEDLAKHSPGPGRYRLRGEIARGGMGAILKVWDDDLKRSLAKKVLLNQGSLHGATADKSLGRFLEEAQVTAQLEHPGIVPVHDLGVDPTDGVYFTMRLVRGRDLRAIFEQIQTGEGGWNQTRGLGVLLKVCEAMAYAHSRNIVHRDLKPANIMVGRFGEVYVMDWGLARVLGHGSTDTPEDASEETPAARSPDDLTEVTTLRDAIGASDCDSPLFTQDGAVIGTPAFMSPEQARGELLRVGPRSDVFSVGAILYQLLTGRMPYAGPGPGDDAAPVPPAQVALQRLLEGPPAPTVELAPDAPAELVAICDKAMARDPEHRYADMLELAADLQAFLEHRVVRAYRTGAAPELAKWVRRNRSTAATLVLLCVVVFAGASFFAWHQHRAAGRAVRAADFREGPALLAELDELGPLRAESLPAMERWLASAEDLMERIPGYRAEFERDLAEGAQPSPAPPAESRLVRKREETLKALSAELDLARLGTEDGHPMDPLRVTSALAILPAVIERRQRDLEFLHAHTLPRTTLASVEAQDRHDRLRTLVQSGVRLSAPELGAISRLRTRMRKTRESEESPRDPRWKDALASIADPAECPAYAGLKLTPQRGLVPLRRDPDTGLWEFLHLQSGAAPEYATEGLQRVTPETGIVLVLLPGGEFQIGAQREPDQPNYDRLALDPELFETPVTLAPFFISKYEVSLAQWIRLTGAEAGLLPVGSRPGAPSRRSFSHPVAGVSYGECETVLRLWSLSFPTEAQLEFATRGGSNLPYGWTAEFEEAAFDLNSWEPYGDWQAAGAPQDGHYLSAPVDAFVPNPYGLFCTLGNVREWCLEYYADPASGFEFAPLTGELLAESGIGRVTRGGSFLTAEPARTCRVSSRITTPAHADSDIGLRPARQIEP